MRISFLVGVFMLIIKCFAYYVTGSTAVLSDAAESIIHIFAVGFAAYSMWLSLKPADKNHLYGHEKVGFFSAGFEGAMIIFAAVYIYVESIHKMIFGFSVQNITFGLALVVIGAVMNFFLGYFLLVKGKKYHSLILEANGRHIMTDCFTSVGVILALILVKVTKIALLDPIIAIICATNILVTGFKLLRKSISGLMDQTDPHLDEQIQAILKKEIVPLDLDFHHLRHRIAGQKIFIEFHLLFPGDMQLKEAHEIASHIEATLRNELYVDAEIFTHLEPKTQHDQIHKQYGLPI